jgi:hypothetical protein
MIIAFLLRARLIAAKQREKARLDARKQQEAMQIVDPSEDKKDDGSTSISGKEEAEESKSDEVPVNFSILCLCRIEDLRNVEDWHLDVHEGKKRKKNSSITKKCEKNITCPEMCGRVCVCV